MATPKVYFGVPNRIKEIPAPESGMGFANAHDVEVTPLVSGGRAVYRAPLSHKTHNMSWKSGAASVQHIVDCYNGQWGNGPFYFTDPTQNDANVLPARWSLGWQLAYQATGWCKPYVNLANPLPDAPYVMSVDRTGVFTQAPVGSPSSIPLEGVLRTRVIREPGKPYYLTIDGSSTGGAGIRVRAYNTSTFTWVLLNTLIDASFRTPVLLVNSANTSYSMIELDFYMPLGSTMTLRGMALSALDYAASGSLTLPVGTGVGPVQFSGDAGGTLASKVIDRIGLSLDFAEVQNVGI